MSLVENIVDSAQSSHAPTHFKDAGIVEEKIGRHHSRHHYIVGKLPRLTIIVRFKAFSSGYNSGTTQLHAKITTNLQHKVEIERME